MSDLMIRRYCWLARSFAALFAFFGMVAAAPSARALAAEMEIMTPVAGKTVVARKAETHLVLRQLASGKPVKVRVDKTGVVLVPVVSEELEEQKYLHFRLPLTPGANSFTILPANQKFEVRYRPVQANINPNSLGKDVHLFHQGDQLPKSCGECHDLQRTKTVEPVGTVQQTGCASCHQNVIDQVIWQHSPTVNLQCLVCHQQTFKPWRIGFPTAQIEEICFSCHTGKRVWRNKEFVHGPMNVGGCNMCHLPHGGNHRNQLWTDGSTALCIACHSEKENLVSKERPLPHVHGIINGMGCVACHDPHAADYPFMVRKPINELCVSCHTGLAGVTRGHPVGGHPVTGPKERRRPNRELNCTSCHDPHGSKYENLLIGDSRGGRLCIACHR